MVIETSVPSFFSSGRSISPHPWEEMVLGMGRDGLGDPSCPVEMYGTLHDQYCTISDTEVNGLNYGGRSM